MAIGTAGVTAMLSVLALERHGVAVEDGPILVTGAGGGVGSVATAVLASAGFEVAAVTGRPDVATYLQTLGAATVIDRDSLMDGDSKPLMSEQWAGCVDSVGSQMLARVLSQMKYNAAVAAVGLAGGADLPTTVIPFIIRGVTLLGIDSVMCSFDRRLEAWNRLANDLPKAALDVATTVIGLSDVPAAGVDILAGKVRGRLVVDLNQ
jgi:acrylyl-CoA reductase (NADPH)